MNHDEEHFAPERVDEQVDGLLRAPLSADTPIDVQIVQGLHALYTEDADILENVWERLGLDEHGSFADALQRAENPQQRMVGQASMLPYERNRRMRVDHHERTSRGSSGRGLAILVAVLIAAILVGSALLVFNNVTRSSQGPAAPGTTNQPQGQQMQQEVKTPSGVYLGSGDGLVLLDNQTGKQIWKYSYPTASFPGLLMTTQVILIGDTAYVGMQSQTTHVKPAVLAIDAQTGKLRWSHEFTNENVRALTEADGILYAAASLNPPDSNQTISQNMQKSGKSQQLPAPSMSSSTIYAFNATDGNTNKKYPITGEPETLSIANGVLYVGTTNALTAINTGDGKQLWSNSINAQSGSITTPQVVNGVVYTALNNVSELAGQTTCLIAAFKVSTGEKLWQTDPIHSQVFDIAVASNKVFVGTMGDAPRAKDGSSVFNGALTAYDAQNGKQLWNRGVDGSVQWQPAVDNGVVYVSAYPSMSQSEEVAAINISDGSIKWHVNVAAGIMTRPVVANGIVYVATGNEKDGATTALKATDGSQLWKVSSSQSPDTLAVSN